MRKKRNARSLAPGLNGGRIAIRFSPPKAIINVCYVQVKPRTQACFSQDHGVQTTAYAHHQNGIGIYMVKLRPRLEVLDEPVAVISHRLARFEAWPWLSAGTPRILFRDRSEP